MTTYKTVYDITIPAGTIVIREAPHDTSFPVETAMIEVDIPILNSMSHLAIDWQDAAESGLVTEVSEDATAEPLDEGKSD
jgi:hypothetical protein